MRIINQSYKIESPLSPEILAQLERAGRTCYKSEENITPESGAKFVANRIRDKHFAVIEFGYMIVRFVCDRGVSHEIVRHRLASYAQESTRYCNYTKEKFDNEITVIRPRGMRAGAYELWKAAMQDAEDKYFTIVREMVGQGFKEKKVPQWARSVLPNSLKTEVVMGANVREWRHFFTMRAAAPAHPQMRELACPLLREVRETVPVLFDDVGDPDCEVDYANAEAA